MKTASLGSIIHGTLRNEDLIPAFLETLKELAEGDEYQTLIGECQDIVDRELWGNLRDELPEVIFDLEGALQEAAPPYCYFGASEGDGSDFGFWICHEAIEQAIYDKELLQVSDLSEVPEGWSNGVILMNDHGNMTYYEPVIAHKEVWSIV